MLEHDVLPAAVLVLPHLDFVIISTSGQHALVFWVGPLYLPNGSLVGLECIDRLLFSIRNSGDKEEPVAIT